MKPLWIIQTIIVDLTTEVGFRTMKMYFYLMCLTFPEKFEEKKKILFDFLKRYLNF